MTNWNSKLEEALHSSDKSAFPRAYKELQEANLPLAGLKKLSREFYGGPARSKADAYRKLYSRHAALKDAAARARATMGRSAA